jgi:hypothetical protein
MELREFRSPQFKGQIPRTEDINRRQVAAITNRCEFVTDSLRWTVPQIFFSKQIAEGSFSKGGKLGIR